VVSQIRLGLVSPWLFTNHPMGNPEAPEGYTWNLGTLYLVWAVAVVILYLASRALQHDPDRLSHGGAVINWLVHHCHIV
jgi:hypothetical protein